MTYLESPHEFASWPTLLLLHIGVRFSKLLRHPLDEFSVDVRGAALAACANDNFIEQDCRCRSEDLVRHDVDSASA